MNSNLNKESPIPEKSNSGEIFRRNLSCLKKNFPALASILCLDTDERIQELMEKIPENYKTDFSREGQPLLFVGGFSLHSKYNPEREACRAIETTDGTFSKNGCIFGGLGLGYYCLEYISRFPDAPVTIVEPDVFIFLLCIKSKDMTPLFTKKNTALFIGLSAFDSATAVEEILQNSVEPVSIFMPPALIKPNQDWFDSFSEIIKRNKEKRGINQNTLKRFGELWLKNMSKNLPEMGKRRGISRFKGIFTGFPVLLLAAGPGLDAVLPILGKLQKKCLVVAVDTALRACLRSGVQPDFLLLVDPQYWNYRHIAGLSSGNTFLITESAAYPAVFRFKCRDIFLCSSLFPLGKFLESRAEEKGALGAGGSVATTAWDFARYTGSSTIYAAGLDLGYPDKATHFRGALFEEKNLSESCRLSPAETGAAAALLSGGIFYTAGYGEKQVLTDRRLNLYAWWFEAAATRHPEIKTFILEGRGIRIPGMEPVPVENLLNLPDCRCDLNSILEKAWKGGLDPEETSKIEKAFILAQDELEKGLKEILILAERGENRCRRFQNEIIKAVTPSTRDGILKEFSLDLGIIDTQIKNHPVKDVLAMTFTGESDSENTDKNTGEPEESPGTGLPFFEITSKSMEFYSKITEAALKNLSALKKK